MSKTHKWKMTDKPHEIAKKYKFRKFEEIWNAPENKKLKSSRKKPENIKKGDDLVIPLSQKEKAEVAKQVADLKACIMIELSLANKLGVNAKLFEEAVGVFGRYIDDSNSYFLKLEAEIDGNLKQAQKWGDGVDLAKDLIMMVRGLVKLSKTAKQSTKASGKALAEINKKMIQEAADMANAPIKKLESMAKKALSDYLKKEGSSEIKGALAVIESVDKSFENMQKPSFWAVTAASLLDGKSWSESVTRDLVAEKNQQKAGVARIRLQQHSKMARIRVEQAKLAQRCRKAQKEALKRAKDYEKALKLLIKP